MCTNRVTTMYLENPLGQSSYVRCVLYMFGWKGCGASMCAPWGLNSRFAMTSSISSKLMSPPERSPWRICRGISIRALSRNWICVPVGPTWFHTYNRRRCRPPLDSVDSSTRQGRVRDGSVLQCP